MVHGGVNFEPYKAKLFESIGKKIACASKHSRLQKASLLSRIHKAAEGLLLNTNSGIFFEFVPAGEIFNENPERDYRLRM